ncbi:unnamed protein product, partial [Adineta ricciae]
MKRKNPFSSSVTSKHNSDSTEYVEENSSDHQSSDKVKENSLDKPLNQNDQEDKQTTSSRVTKEQFLAAANELELDEKQLNRETWRFNDFTRSDESVWGRLTLKLKLNQTENVRHSLYNFWRRHRAKIVDNLSKKWMDSAEETNKSEKVNEGNFSSLSSEIKPLMSNASVPYPATRSAAQQQLYLPSMIEASFILSRKEWREIYDRSERRMISEWTSTICTKVCSCNFQCVLAFLGNKIGVENSRKTNCPFFRAVAVCKIGSCERTFEILIRDEPPVTESVVFLIRAVGQEKHDETDEAASRKLTGKNRLIVGEAADIVGPLKVFHQKLEDADKEMLSARNFTGCETLEVIKHAVADYRKKYKLDEDIFRECRVRQQLLEDIDVVSAKIKGYVQVIGEKPFRLHLTSEAQVLRFITYCAKSTYSHVHIDATGSIVKNLPHQKIVLLYAAVFKDGNDPTNTIPLGHAILADHTATSISYFIGNLRQHVVTLVDKVIRPSFFVTDFSPALFNAILQTFNHEDIRSHLKRCWNVVLRKYDAKELRSRSFLRFCCSHVMNACARSLSAANVAKGIRKKVMHVFALFINCGELELSFRFLKRVLHVFGNPYATDAENVLQCFLNAPYDMEGIPENIGSCDFEVADDSIDPLDEVDENMQGSKAIIHGSPFNTEAIRRFPEISELLNSRKKYENITNPLFCRRIIYVVYKWFAYLPLWTSLLTEFEDRYATDRTPVDIRKYEQGRLSNAQIECYFGILKDSILQKKTNLRPAEVIVSLYRSVQVHLKADKFGVGQMAKNRRGKPKDVNIEESWGKRKAQKKERNIHFSRIDKCKQKRLVHKATSPKPKAVRHRAETVSPVSKAISPRSKLVREKSEPIGFDLQPNDFDNSCLLISSIQNKTDHILNNITNAAVPNYPPDFSTSKSAESFCGSNLLIEQCFSDNSPVVSPLSQPVSPFNIFSALQCESSTNVLSRQKPMKTLTENEFQLQDYYEKQQEKQNNENTDVTIIKSTCGRRPSSENVFEIETLDSTSSRGIHRMVTIDQCPLLWPAFGIYKKSFEGKVYSVTNTCSIDAALFAIYVIFWTESSIKSVILNSEAEPFLSLRKTFALVESNGWDEARLYWLTSHSILAHQQSNQ